MSIQSKIGRLAEAGLVSTDNLTHDDRGVIDQLTEEEITVLIQVATRLYPDARAMVRLGDLGDGLIRLCVPL
jgi:hypothetical protein